METGIKGYAKTVVSKDNTALSLGSGTLPVFATPAMVALMEKAAYKSVSPYLLDGQSTVGTKMEIEHISASPLGVEVHAESELTQIDRRRLTFSVSAYDSLGLIGKGIHERFIIENEAFLAKCNEKQK